MVTQRGLVKCMENVEAIAREAKADKETAKRVIKAIEVDMIKRRRQKAPPPPEGGISVREAHRRYKIPIVTLSRWANKGKVEVVLRTANWLYIDEASLIEYIKAVDSGHKHNGK